MAVSIVNSRWVVKETTHLWNLHGLAKAHSLFVISICFATFCTCKIYVWPTHRSLLHKQKGFISNDHFCVCPSPDKRLQSSRARSSGRQWSKEEDPEVEWQSFTTEQMLSVIAPWNKSVPSPAVGVRIVLMPTAVKIWSRKGWRCCQQWRCRMLRSFFVVAPLILLISLIVYSVHLCTMSLSPLQPFIFLKSCVCLLHCLVTGKSEKPLSCGFSEVLWRWCAVFDVNRISLPVQPCSIMVNRCFKQLWMYHGRNCCNFSSPAISREVAMRRGAWQGEFGHMEGVWYVAGCAVSASDWT